MVVEANAGREAYVRANLKLVLQIETGFPGAIVTVGIALEIGAGDEAVRTVGDYLTLEELREIGECDGAGVGPLIARVELGVGETAAEGEGVFAESPNGVRRRHEAVLTNAGESALGIGAIADVGGGVEDEIGVVRRLVTVVVYDGNAGKYF